MAPKSPNPDLHTEVLRLRHAVSELSILNELARDIGASMDPERVMRKVIARSLRAVNAEQGSITLVGHERTDPHKTLVRDMVSSSEHKPYHLDQALLGWMHLNKKILSLKNPQQDRRFSGIHWDKSIHTLLCVPLIIKNRLTGILTVLNKRDGEEFNEADIRLLAIIASQSAQVIENARLYREEQKLIKMQEELRVARDIQLGLLPETIPDIPGYDIAGNSIQAQEVGGDYFDVIPMENKLAVCVGDASGHGLPAALLMSNLQAIIRSQTYMNCSAAECVNRANTLLHKSTQAGRFATFFFGLLDYQKHIMVYTNAGHSYPVLVKSNGDVRILSESGVVLSFVPDYTYQEVKINIDAGDVLCIFSDGAFEVENEKGEQFGETRLVEAIQSHSKKCAEDLLQAVHTSIDDFRGERPLDDDMTLLVMKSKKEE